MSEQPPTDLLSALPRTRPHRRSGKRGAPPAGSKPPAPRAPRSAAPATKPARSARAAREPAGRSPERRLRQPAQPGGIPSARRAPKRKPAPATRAELVGTAVQAVGELAEIGLALGARALRNAVSRLPRP